ncbi:MAG TPA: Uma2 family endonuclease [Gemmataceae bacterium]|nr:Uma2 family endonuclease [Gemmataceae bacterium]
MTTVEQQVQPLTAGDKLSREEFLRIWEEHPEIKFAELIGGVVYMPSPLSIEHGDTDQNLGAWMCYYRTETPGTASGNNTTAFLLNDTPQADGNLRILPECGGKSRVKGKYLAGKPELFGEVCLTSAAYDLHQKLDLYEAAGIPEYLAVLMHEKEIRWHVLVDQVYQLMPPDADGIWRSRVFPGLWLDGKAFLAGNQARVFEVLKMGLASREHQAFVKKLAKARRAR